MDSDYLIDSFVMTRPGDPFRLFPFGVLIKGGVRRDITPELARAFKLPHFKPAIKLGNHADETPAGGHIVGLEVRDDGLYAIPEYNDAGSAALAAGSYRYQSPEIVWEGGSLEDPTTGARITGPLIVGDALLHTPHLGEAAALYSVDITEVQNMTESTVTVPASTWDKFMARLFPEKPPVETPEPPKAPASDGVDQMTAIVAERDRLSAEIETMKAEQHRAERLSLLSAELATTKAPVAEGASILAAMTDEQAAWVIQQFKALSAQIVESAIVGEVGSPNPGLPDNPVMALDTSVRAIMSEKKLDYTAALKLVEPAIVLAAYPTKRAKEA
jgi:hypothetical protein